MALILGAGCGDCELSVGMRKEAHSGSGGSGWLGLGTARGRQKRTPGGFPERLGSGEGRETGHKKRKAACRGRGERERGEQTQVH